MAYDIPDVLQSNKQGMYDKLIAKAASNQQQPWDYTIAPPARVDEMFNQKLVDCIIPFDTAFHQNKQTINTLPLYVATARIYSRRQIIQQLQDLKGLRVGARKGMLYGPEFDKLKLNVNYVTRIEQNIDMLSADRIDAFVAWSPDAEAAMNKKAVTFLRSEPFIAHNDAFLCHDTPKTRAFVAQFNQGLKSITKKN